MLVKKKTPIRPVALVAMLFLSISRPFADESTPPKGFETIFNGGDLTGWNGSYPPPPTQQSEFAKHWTVENGELVSDGKGSYATTREAYGNFELMLEFKTVAGADGGIHVRGIPEIQIGDGQQAVDPNRDKHRSPFGSGGLIHNRPNTLGHAPLCVRDSSYGRWNKLRIQQVGSRTWVTLNNMQVVMGAELENSLDPGKPLPASGPIRLHAEGGEIRWRNIFIREMTDAAAERFLVTHPPLPNPTEYDVSYGPHFKQVLHFWKVESEKPTPVVFFIHGGSWMTCHRLVGLSPMLTTLLEGGVSVVSVEYRFIQDANAGGVVPPVKAPLHDAARALQLVRSKATEWNIDKERIGASGTSAGACSSLWLAFHPDMADPDSDDPVARESTRLFCAAVNGAQTTLDPQQMKDWTPNSTYGAHAFNLGTFENFLAKRETILPWIAEFSPYALVTPDDPPVYLSYGSKPDVGKPAKDPTHTSNFGVKLQEHCRSLGVTCELAYPGAPDVKHKTLAESLLFTLNQPAAQ